MRFIAFVGAFILASTLVLTIWFGTIKVLDLLIQTNTNPGAESSQVQGTNQ